MLSLSFSSSHRIVRIFILAFLTRYFLPSLIKILPLFLYLCDPFVTCLLYVTFIMKFTQTVSLIWHYNVMKDDERRRSTKNRAIGNVHKIIEY